MVLPSLFHKSSSKKPKQPDPPKLAPGAPLPKSHPGTPPSSPDKRSPDKKSHTRVKDKDRDRRSASYSSKRSSKYDRDSHPLNLPPDELRRLSSSAMSAMADQPTPQAMDVDRDNTASPPPSSPLASTPKSNGVNGDEDRPAPPPHRYTTSPPPPSANYAATPEAASTPPAQAPTIDAEEYKAAGNKFFKIKDYPAAIKEYSKGAYTVARASCAALQRWTIG
jgi:DnaJ family protein C protein 7